MIPVMAVDDDDEESNQSLRPVQGQLSYLQIPAIDVRRSAQFYARVFGWNVEHPHPGFDAPGLIGQWVTDRRPTRDAGMLPWLNVDSIDEAMKLVRAHGGEVLEHPTPDGPERLLSTVRDPAGNVLGLVQLVSR
jgi:predicted enzyme related to lactoylglutathione lyase